MIIKKYFKINLMKMIPCKNIYQNIYQETLIICIVPINSQQPDKWFKYGITNEPNQFTNLNGVQIQY